MDHVIEWKIREGGTRTITPEEHAKELQQDQKPEAKPQQEQTKKEVKKDGSN